MVGVGPRGPGHAGVSARSSLPAYPEGKPPFGGLGRLGSAPAAPFLTPNFHEKGAQPFLFNKFYKFRRKLPFIFNDLRVYR